MMMMMMMMMTTIIIIITMHLSALQTSDYINLSLYKYHNTTTEIHYLFNFCKDCSDDFSISLSLSLSVYHSRHYHYLLTPLSTYIYIYIYISPCTKITCLRHLSQRIPSHIWYIARNTSFIVLIAHWLVRLFLKVLIFGPINLH